MQRVRDVLNESRRYRDRYGFIQGLWLWYALRADYRLKAGSVFQVRLPGHSASIFLRAGTSDVSVLRQLFVEDELAFPIDESASFIIDAGANIGLASVYFARKCPSALIVALEVDRGNFVLLERNTRSYKNVSAIRKALWSTRGHVRIANPDDRPWAFRVIKADSSDGDAVEAVSVDTIVHEFRPGEISLLKMDIEGAEREVLGADVSGWIGRVKVLAIELHDRLHPGCSESLRNALQGRAHTATKHGEYEVIYFSPKPDAK